MYVLASFVKDKVCMGTWIYLWAFYFVPMIYISVFVPVPYCLYVKRICLTMTLGSKGIQAIEFGLITGCIPRCWFVFQRTHCESSGIWTSFLPKRASTVWEKPGVTGHIFKHWRRKWQPTPRLLPGESHGQSSLVGYSPWVAKSRTRLSGFTSLTDSSLDLPLWLGGESTCNAGDAGLIPGSWRSPGRGHGNPLQYSCLKNSMDRGAWWATV